MRCRRLRTTQLHAALLIALGLLLAGPAGLAQAQQTTADEAGTASDGGAEEGGVPENPFSDSRILVFPLLAVGPSPELEATGESLVDLLSRSLGTEFEDAGFDVVIGDALAGLDGAAEPGAVTEAALAAAGEADADFVGIGFAGFPDGRVVVNTRVYDANSGGLVAAASGFGRSDLAVFNITRRIFRDLRPGLERAVARRRGTGVVDVAGELPVADPLVLASPDEGMQVSLGDNLQIGTISDGVVSLPYLPLRPGETLPVRKRKPGYYPETEEVLVREGGSAIELEPLEPETRFATTLTYTTGQMLGFGLGVRGYLRPDWSFLAGETYGYVQSNNPGASSAAYHQDLRLTFGRYLGFPRTSRFRFGAQTGVGTTFTFFSSPEAPTYRDTYIEIFGLWIEFNLPEVAFFLSSAARWSVGRDNGLLDKGMIEGGEAGAFLSAGTVVKWQR